MTDFNQVLEEAIAATHILVDRAAEGEGEAEALRQKTDDALEQLDDQAREFHDRAQAATTACRHAQEQVTAQVHAAREDLQALPHHAELVEAQLGHVTSAFQENLVHLAERRERLQGATDTAVHDVEEGFVKLDRDVHAFRERLEEGLRAAEQHAQHLVQDVAESEQHLQQEQQLLLQVLDELRTSGQDVTRQTAQALETLLAAIGTEAVALCNKALAGHNRAVHALRSGLTDEQPGSGPAAETWIQHALAPVRAALDEFARIREPIADAVQDSVVASLDRGQAALASLTGIAESLNRASAALGS